MVTVEVMRQGGEGFGRVFGLEVGMDLPCGKHRAMDYVGFRNECCPEKNVIFEQGIDERGGMEWVDMGSVLAGLENTECPVCEHEAA